MANTKEIQRRIKSISNTKKITKAMEMVAAAKMRKAIEAVLKTRTYANLSWTTVINLSKAINSGKSVHPLLSKREKIKTIGIILFSSNRGLCGGFNSSVMNKAHASILKHHSENGVEKIKTEFIVVGKKGVSIHSRYGYKVVAEFKKLDISSEVAEVRSISHLIITDYLSGRYDKIMVAFTDFVSASTQAPRIKQILPIDITAEDHHLGVVGKDSRVGLDIDFITEKEDKYLKNKKNTHVFTYEPNAETVLSQMLPRLIEIQLFQALLESNASEHSARMSAMHMANESAEDLLSDLTLFYNKARQTSITSEIAEIAAGAEALNK